MSKESKIKRISRLIENIQRSLNDDLSSGVKTSAENDEIDMLAGLVKRLIEKKAEDSISRKHQELEETTIPRLEQSKVPLRTHNGDVSGVSGPHEDITERKRIENELRDSESTFRTIFDNTHDAIFVHSADGTILDVNQKMLELYRVTREQALRSSIAGDFSTPENPLDQLRDRWNRVLKGESLTFEWKARRPNDGSSFDVEVALKKIKLSKRSVVLANVRDISIRKAKEALLKKNEEKFRDLVERSNDAIMRYDWQHRHLYVNPIVQKETGIPQEEFIGKTHKELGFPEPLCVLCEEAIDRVFYSGEIHRIEFQLPKGLWIDWMLIPEMDESGKVRTVITLSRDITGHKQAEEEREKLQAQLSQAQKMESVGRLAGGVAHDFNNMLSVIIGYAELAMNDVTPDHPLFFNLQEIRKAAKRSADLTRQLLAFARKQTVIPEVLDLNKTVEGMLKMLRRLIGEDIDLVWMPGPEIWKVNVDPSQIDQMLANLCVNARDAISGVGKIIIKTETVTFDETYCTYYPDVIPGDYVLLSISDDGCGMDKSTMDKLFEPFFTTKEIGKGTGLGLATIYGIIKQNNGFINVFSEPGHGSTFKIYLPRHTAKIEQTENRTPAAPASLGHETILLVEDEPAILDLGKLMLESLGYHVMTALTPGEAIRIAEEHNSEINLLITDMIMPEKNGGDLVNDITSFIPGIKHLFISGYTGDVMARHGLLDQGANFIQKPFSLEGLASKVRELLDSK